MRLEARKKMGYYPTPSAVIGKLKPFFKFSSGQASLFDPCCGEGLALQELAAGGNAITYGIELDTARAAAAKQRLDHVVGGDYRQTKISPGVFSVLLLNPPYDFDEDERKELIFLRDTLAYLQPQGILIYIIPQPRLEEKIAKLLSLHCKAMRVFQFPAEEYQPFKQIVVLGIKKLTPAPDTQSLEELQGISEQQLPEIPAVVAPIYQLPESKPVVVFKSSVVDMLKLHDALQISPLRERIASLVAHQESGQSQRPPLPLRTGHIALVLASGFLDGEVGDDANLHIVKGRVFKETKKTTEVLENEVVHRETDVIRISIKILLPNGSIKVLV